MADGSLTYAEPVRDLRGVHPRTLQGEDGLVPLLSFGGSSLLHL